MDPRVVKPQLPARVVVSAVAIGLGVFAFIVFAVWQSGADIKNARMTGVIVRKEFVPGPREKQIIIGRDRSFEAHEKEGDYILTVDVTKPDGSKEPYKVFLFDKKQFDSYEVGQQFDVGPYLAPE